MRTRHLIAMLGGGQVPGRAALVLTGIASIALVACGGTTHVSVVSPVRTREATAAPTTTPPLAIDPCALLTQQQASAMGMVALSSGRLTSGDCYFSGYTPEASLTLQVTQSPDAVDALTVFKTIKEQLSSSWTVTDVAAIEDAAAIAHVDSGGTSLSGILVLDGSVVFTVVCEQLACSDAALEAGAKTIAGQLGTFSPTA